MRQYINYSRLKRIIKRRKFVTDQRLARLKKITGEGSRLKLGSSALDMRKLSNTGFITETTPLMMASAQSKKEDPTAEEGSEAVEAVGVDPDGVEFFPVIIEEINKINKFFVAKMAELRIALEEITSTRSSLYRSHHTISDPSHLIRLRNIYVELAALRSYCTLCRTGFYKIVKKYDKTMGESTMDTWMATVEKQPFTVTEEPLQLMEVITGLVSRDKLIEWERFATEQQNKSGDDLFPSVRLYGLLISVVVFLCFLVVPVITPRDPCASRCLSLFALVLSLWVTEAIPYYATAMLICPLVVLMRVLKDEQDPSQAVSVELAATYVMSHLFNHTTMLLLGGYTISTAFSRCQLELRIASLLQRHLGNSPSLFILAIMFLGLFLSMWISNHTAPILCATIILPIVRDLPTDSRYAQCDASPSPRNGSVCPVGSAGLYSSVSRMRATSGA